jgi:hypothetical protein
MRYWFSRDCLAAHFVAYWGVADVLTTLFIVHVSSIALEVNPAMSLLIGVHPAVFAAVKLAAAAGVAYLLYVHARESRLAHGLLLACTVFAVLLVAGNLATIIWLVT